MNTTAATVTSTISENIYRFTSSPKLTAPKVQTALRNLQKVMPGEAPRKDLNALYTDYLMAMDAPAATRPAAVATYLDTLTRTVGQTLTPEEFGAL